MDEIQSDRADDQLKRQLESGPQEKSCHQTGINKAQISKVPSFFLDNRILIIFSHACQGILKIWGPYSNLQNLFKIWQCDTQNFDQSELRTLKSVRAVNVQMKQFSYLM